MNNRKNLILIFCILIFNNVFCQFQGTVIESKTVNMNVSISLFEDSKYLIVLQSMWDGNIVEYGLSMGSYVCSKDTVICTDLHHKYTLIFLHTRDELQQIKSFPYMMNHKFISYGSNFDESYTEQLNNIFLYYRPLFYRSNNQQHKILMFRTFI